MTDKPKEPRKDHPEADRESQQEETDLLDLVLRTAGWLALATGIGMLAFFLHWWRAQG